MNPFSGGGRSVARGVQRAGPACLWVDLEPGGGDDRQGDDRDRRPSFRTCRPSHTRPSRSGRSIYRNAEGLAEDVKFYGEWMREKALQRFASPLSGRDLPAEYGGGKATVAGLEYGARTVTQSRPSIFCDVRVSIRPPSSSFLGRARKFGLKPIVDRVNKSIRYSIRKGGNIG